MRVVLDTNILVSGIISPGGPPRKLLNGVRMQAIELCSSAILLAELLDVLNRDKFVQRLTSANLTAHGIVMEVRRLASLVDPVDVPRVIPDDPDDDHVLACAIAARAELIISGDRHLLGLGGSYRGIRIVSPAEAVNILLG